MKKMVFLVSILCGLNFAGLFGDSPEPGYAQTYFNLLLPEGDATYGNISFYYDDTIKSMTIRFRQSDSGQSLAGQHFYCYENDNPKLYNMIFNFVQKSMDSWNAYHQKNGDASPIIFSVYGQVSFWFKTINGKNIIKGITFYPYPG